MEGQRREESGEKRNVREVSVVMVNRLEGESSLSRLRGILREEGTEFVTSPGRRLDLERDLCDVSRRLERLQRLFPEVAAQVELNVDLVKAGERLAMERDRDFGTGSREE